MNIPVFDLHCDTALALQGQDGQVRSLRQNNGHIDLARAKELSGFCQCFACFTSPLMEQWTGRKAEEIFAQELKTITDAIKENADVLSQVRSAKDVADNCAAGRMSAVLTLEGAAGIGFDPARLEEMHGLGFRIVSLSWNEQNVLTGSNVTGGGLTDLGRVFVKEAQRVGMIVDVSHISDEAFWDIMDITQAPVVATHSNSRAICNHSRNLTDDMFRQIIATGGVAGFNQYGAFIGDPPTLDAACAHFLHFMELDPDGKHIALGGDLDGCEVLTSGFTGVESYPMFADALKCCGLSGANIQDIYWNNAIGVMERCCI